MPPDPLNAFHDAVRYGPAGCPADLFEGGVAHVIRGLKVHANNIAHARRVALAETYPRLLALMGDEPFHAAATRFLDTDAPLSRSLDALGEGITEVLNEPAERDLARAEWAWLQSFHAAEAVPLTLAHLSMMLPETLVDVPVRRHPGAAVVVLQQPDSLAWDEALPGDGEALLMTRPEASVLVRRIAAPTVALFATLDRPRCCGELLGDDPNPLLPLIEAGALTLETVS